MGIRKQLVNDRKHLLFLAIILGGIFLYFNSTSLLAKPLCDQGTECTPTIADPVASKLKNAAWIHKGLIKLTFKTGDPQYFEYYDSTGSTWRFALKGGGECGLGGTGDAHLIKRPNAYLSIEKNEPGTATYLKIKEGAKTCVEPYSNLGAVTLNTENRSVFWQEVGTDSIHIWHNQGAVTFQKKAIPGDKANWKQYYERSDEGDGICKDAIAETKDGTWVLFPMMEWTEDNAEQWPYASGAQSEGYHYLQDTKSKSTPGSIYESCRVSAHRVPNVYLLGSIDYTDPEQLEPARDYKVNLSEKDGYDQPFQICGDEPGDYDGWYKKVLSPPKYMNVTDTVNDLQIKDGKPYVIGDVHDDSGADYNMLYEVTVNWDGDAPSHGYNWLIDCKRTDDPKGDGNWAYHTLRVWDNRSYGMTGDSNNRLLNLSEDNLATWKWTYNDAGDAENDGYQILPQVAQVSHADAQMAGDATDVDLTEPPAGDEGEDADDATTCAIEGIGWIVCPVVRFLGKITDLAYGILANELLEVPAGEIFKTSGTAYQAWSAVRNLANIAFVIAFLIIIYSQITGLGLSNYGIKRMLPRLFVTVILVNTSFWLCAAAVDISNVVGHSLKDILAPGDGSFAFTIQSEGTSKTGNGWTDLAVAVLATAALVYVGISVLLPALVAVAFAIVTVVVVLAARQAIIILLIVISPLAFVAYLLPNTEQWFKRWMDFFKTMLLMFPVISLIFGASALASVIIMGAANGSPVVSIIGALIAIVPLFITPIVMKSAGGVLNRVGGFINNPNKGPFDRLRKGAEGIRANRQEYRKLKAMSGGSTLPGRGVLARRGARRDAVLSNRKAELNRANTSYIADKAQQDPGFAAAMAAGGGAGANSRVLSQAINAQAKLELEEVKAEHAIIDSLGQKEIADIVESGRAGGHSDAKIAAALERLAQVGSQQQVANAVNKYASSGESTVMSRSLGGALAQENPGFLKGSDIDAISRGDMTVRDDDGNVVGAKSYAGMVGENVRAGVMSQEKMADATGDALAYAKSVSDATGKQVLAQTATALKSNDNLKGKIKHNASAIDDLMRP
jgi:hypothetical protein